MRDPLAATSRALEDLEARDQRRYVRSAQSRSGAYIRRDGKELLNLGSNDYLGLSTHPSVIAAAARAVEEWGAGSGSARLIAGSTTLHDQLEQELAALKGTEDAVLLSSGYLANLAAMTTLAGPEDVILSDALNHASLIDAVRLSGAHRHVYAHADVNQVEDLLRAHAAARRIVIATDGVFSMDGDIAPLRDLTDLAQRYGAALYVDDAHGTGVLGGGAGSIAETGAAADLVMGTLSKALGSLGGFLAGDHDVCELIRNQARAFIFDTALPASACAAALESLRILREQPELPRRARTLATQLAGRLREGGISTNEPSAAIVPVIIGSAAESLRVAGALEASGYLVPAIRPPSVPEGTSRLRVSLMASISDDDVVKAAEAILGVVSK